MSRYAITGALSDTARDTTGQTLQDTLVDLVDLALIGKQAHWNVVGPNFRSVHLQLDELVNAARLHADAVAERATSIGVSPHGSARAVTDQSGLPAFPSGWQSVVDTIEAVVSTLAVLIQRLRQAIADVEETDLVSQDLLIGVAADLEKAHWMWQAQLS